jgi:Uri superfamily endonuclease
VKAVYCAFFKIEQKMDIEIGALGEKQFEPGIYIYVGSAMTNVEKRLERHFSKTENKHWHIDYFSAEAEPLDYFILPENSEYECVLAEKLEGFCEPVQKFGSSDCSCNSHLFRFN